jgi:hypothetical protein
MKTNRIIQRNLAALALLSAFNLLPSALLGQGSLTPPGAPAPTMKSADQIEPRTIVNAVNTPGDQYDFFVIRHPGSYYLTTNLTVSSGSGIAINTNGVTLDLNGFTISSTSPAGSGISLGNGLSDITIVNGHIRGGENNNGFQNGIVWNDTVSTNVVISKVSVSGVPNNGINVAIGNATVVEDCTVTTVGGYGICASTIKSSVATDCGYHAIYGDQVTDCRGISTGSGFGVYASATAQNCYGQSSSGTGLFAPLAIGCSGSSSSGTGLNAWNASFCNGSRPGGTAIQAGVATGCYSINGTNIITYKYNMP